jgi:PmbA protein
VSNQPEVVEGRLTATVDRIVADARSGEQVEAFAMWEREASVRAYDGEVESFTAAELNGVGIRVIVEGRQGFAYCGTLDEDAIRDALADARDNARYAEPDEFAGLAQPDGVPVPRLDLFDARLLDVPADRKIALALELEASTRAADKRISGIESAEYVDAVVLSAVASTTGVRSLGRDSGCYLAVYTLAEDGDDVQTGYGFSVGRHPDRLDVARAAREGADRATRLLGAIKPPSSRLTVVLDPFVTAQLLGIVGETLSGEAVAKKRSLFGERLGEQVASPLFSLVDDPTDIRAFSASEADGEGLACRRNPLIVDGVLQQFVHNAYTARRFGTHSTGNAVRGGYKGTPGCGPIALALTPGDRSPADLISEVDHGLLVQEVSGLHSGVNPISGDFSTGAQGLMIRGGSVAEPVREITIASTLQRLLLDLVAVGNDLEWLPAEAAGITLVVADVMMSGD